MSNFPWLSKFVSLATSFLFLFADPAARLPLASGQSSERCTLAPSSAPSKSLEVLMYWQMLEADGFMKDFAGLVALAAGEASTPIREILEDVEYSDTPKEVSIINKLIDTFKLQDNVEAIAVVGQPEMGYSRTKGKKGKYKIVISQENFDVVKKSNLGIGTLIGIYDEKNQLVGSFFFLNGPITTMIVADGKGPIAHYAHDGKEYGRRDKKLDLVKSTDDKSPAALGGAFTDWPVPFADFYVANKQAIPGAGEIMKEGKPAPSPSLKTRYGGVAAAPAMAANMYEILINNGFLAEAMSVEEARLWAPFAQAAGGDAMALTPHGLVSISAIPDEVTVVQLCVGNKGVAEKLIASGVGKDQAKKIEIKPPVRSPYQPSGYKADTFKPENTLESMLGNILVATQPESHDLFNAMVGVEEVARKVPILYVMGGKATGEIDSGGAEVKKIDVQTDHLFAKALAHHVGGYHSEEGKINYENGAGLYLTFLGDPLDGSSKVESNGGGGTIGAFVRVPQGESHVGKNGRDVVASFFITYGVQTKLVLAVKGKGVHEFILNKKDGKFYRVRQIQLGKPDKKRGVRIALGGSRSVWPAGFPGLVDRWTKAGAANGYSGAMVTDVYGVLQHILDGGAGIFAYLDKKLRVKYEESPIALILEEAGGDSLTHDFVKMEDPKAKNPPAVGVMSVLDRPFRLEKDTKDQQKAPVALGDKQTIEEIRLALIAGTPAVGAALEKVRAKGRELAGLTGDMPITQISQEAVRRMQMVLDEHWVGDDDYNAIRSEAGEYGAAYATLVARHEKLRFDLIMALRQSAAQKKSDPVHAWLEKTHKYIRQGLLAAEVVEDTIADMWLNLEKAPILNSYHLGNLLDDEVYAIGVPSERKPHFDWVTLKYTTLSAQSVSVPVPGPSAEPIAPATPVSPTAPATPAPIVVSETQRAIAGVLKRLKISLPEDLSEMDAQFIKDVMQTQFGDNPLNFGTQLYQHAIAKKNFALVWDEVFPPTYKRTLDENDRFLSFLRDNPDTRLNAIYDGIEQTHVEHWKHFAADNIRPNLARLVKGSRSHTGFFDWDGSNMVSVADRIHPSTIMHLADMEGLTGTHLSQSMGGVGLSQAALDRVQQVLSDASDGILTTEFSYHRRVFKMPESTSRWSFTQILNLAEGAL